MSPEPKVQSPESTAFTLIEIMIVVAIMAIMMTMSVPIVYKLWHKAPMQTAVREIVEVCSHARARAILQGKVTEVVFHPKENRLEVAGAVSPASASGDDSGSSVPASGLSAQLPSQVIIELLDINMSGVEYRDADEARVRFFPNGVCDEMRMILFDGRNRMGIELEVTTGLANVVPNPLQAWRQQ
jgi:prepilin-type N-terminal cleavage/methylation domain-containing protein